ncbi:hypothetical protein KSP39_PZI000507 [Platanthera zijinensis]|uniref:N-acetyltransferase domain-containing protein n=1 Tax=Platanthera zijinensis TaxID=2320716 RepID=A0AAP0C0K1_9ASPA
MQTEGAHLTVGHEGRTTNRPPAITFRQFQRSESDFAAIMDFGTDERVTRFLHFDLFRCRDDAVRFIDTFVLPHPWFRFICLSGAGDQPVGMVVLRPEDTGGGRRRVSLGYSVAPELWGRGIATEAAKMMIEVAFEQWSGVDRVQTLVMLDNPASQRVLEKAGFQREAVLRKYMIFKGQIRDLVMYSFLSTDRRLSHHD